MIEVTCVDSTIRLTIRRKDQPEPADVSVVRRLIRVQTVFSQTIGGDVGYIRIAKFNDLTAVGLQKALEDISTRIPASRLRARPRKARLGDILEDVGTKTLKYLYDFGDGWEHTIKVERLINPESGVLYPRLIEAKGHCPPDDVGGPWGYSEFLEAIADPSHERHRELKEWFADDFNPHVVDVDWLSEDVAELAQRWSRQPAVKRRRTG